MDIEPPPSSRSLLRWSAAVAVVGLFVAIPFVLWDAAITAWIQELAASGRPAWAVAGALGGLLASDLVLPVPSSIVSTALGAVVGLWPGACVSWIGMTLGACVGYAAGRTAGRPLARRWVGEVELDVAEGWFERWGAWAVIILRPVPLLAEASVVFAGVGRMTPRRFGGLVALSNAGISLGYAAVGAWSMAVSSFLVAFCGALVVPGIFLLATRGSTSATDANGGGG